MGYFNCVDVSEWNQEIDWNAAKADGVEYAFIRCGFGKDSEKQDDKYFHINMENAIAAGVKVGVYFYAYAVDYDSAVAEAHHCIRLVEQYKDDISFPVFYDVEEQQNVPRISDVVMGFINTMNYYGYNCGVYTGGSWYSAYFRNIDCDYIWLAYWGSDDGVPHTKPDYCDVWQYTSKGSVDGIGYGCVDCDILYNTEMKLLMNDPDPKPEPTPTPAPAPMPPSDPVKVELDILSRGSTGGQVNTIKALLNEFGFGNGLPLDSDFDWDTEQAVNRYKERFGLEINGIVDEAMWNLILK